MFFLYVSVCVSVHARAHTSGVWTYQNLSQRVTYDFAFEGHINSAPTSVVNVLQTHVNIWASHMQLSANQTVSIFYVRPSSACVW